MVSSFISDQAQAFLNSFPEDREPPTDISDPVALATSRGKSHAEFLLLADHHNQPYELKDEDIDGVSCLIIDGDHVATDEQVLLHVHGGAYVYLEPRSSLAYSGQIGLLSQRRIISPDYSLAPEHPFPTALSELRRVYIHLLDTGYRPDNIAVFGESAGAGLALALALSLKEHGDPLPSCLALVSPWADLAGEGDTYETLKNHDPLQVFEGDYDLCGQAYAGTTPTSNPLVSPVYADLEGMPPMLIQAGLRDILASDALTLNRNARTTSVDVTLDIWEGMVHVWHVFGDLPEAQEANQELADFLVSRLPAVPDGETR